MHISYGRIHRCCTTTSSRRYQCQNMSCHGIACLSPSTLTSLKGSAALDCLSRHLDGCLVEMSQLAVPSEPLARHEQGKQAIMHIQGAHAVAGKAKWRMNVRQKQHAIHAPLPYTDLRCGVNCRLRHDTFVCMLGKVGNVGRWVPYSTWPWYRVYHRTT